MAGPNRAPKSNPKTIFPRDQLSVVDNPWEIIFVPKSFFVSETARPLTMASTDAPSLGMTTRSTRGGGGDAEDAEAPHARDADQDEQHRVEYLKCCYELHERVVDGISGSVCVSSVCVCVCARCVCFGSWSLRHATPRARHGTAQPAPRLQPRRHCHALASRTQPRPPRTQ